MRAIDFKLNRILPENLRRDKYDLRKKGVEDLVAELARNPPENYAEILHAIGTIGRNAAYTQGNTVTLNDSKPVVDTGRYYKLMDAEIDALESELKDGKISDNEFTRLRNDVYVKYSDEIGDVTLGQALKSGNNYAKAVASGARGKGQNLKALISTPGIYQDAKGKVIPLFVRNSFAQGVRPADSLAGSYGARASVTSTKKATAKGGDLLKLITQAGANVTVTEKDCGVQNGIALDPDDDSIRRRVLAAPIAGLDAGTVVDKRVAATLRKNGKKAMVRSVNTCQSEVGVCSKCAGLNAEGRFPKLGTALGIIEASGVGEPLVQGALCLAGDTMVRMADLSVKKLIDVVVGDWVLGSDKQGHTFPVEVLNTFYQGEKEVYEWTFKVGQTEQYKSLVATKDHKILANTKESGCKGVSLNHESQILPVGTECRDFAAVLPRGMGDHQTAKRVDKESLGKIDTYDIEVDHQDHLFVLANDLIVSNSAKHTAGAAEGKKSYSGFDWVSQFMQVPSEFKDEAAISTENGVVERITEAPQGGHNIRINGKDIYARQGFDVEVKVGQEVEAGDQLSDGLLNPAKVVKYKGLGAGRQYYTDRLQKMLQDSGQKGDRRSIEVIAKAVLSTYRAEDPDQDSDFLPDDIVWEGKVNKRFKPAGDTQTVTPKVGRGLYLQKPVLHYTVGSPVTKSMQKDLEEMDISEVDVSAHKPWFTGEMQRVRAAAHNNRDWMAALSTSYLKKQLEQGAHRGDVTNVETNHHYAPRLAKGDGFGQNVEQTGKF